MQLTSVGHLRLPFGRLLGYDVVCSTPGTRLPISYDQRRHVSAGSRPASWMAISFTLAHKVSLDRLAQAWLAVVDKHSTLRTVFVPGDGGESDPQLYAINVTAGNWIEHAIAPGQVVNDAVRDVLDAVCSPFEYPSHRFLVLDTANAQTVVIGADHAHVDMWSMLVIVRDLLAALGEPCHLRHASTDVAVPGFEEHTVALRERTNVPEWVHRRWGEIIDAAGGGMPMFPLSLGISSTHPARVEVRRIFGVDESAAFAEQAKQEGVSTLSLTVAHLTQVTRRLAGRPFRAVFPVHSRYDDKWHDSVGWFITNSVIESTDPAPQAAAAAVKEAVQLGSWPLTHILAPWGGDLPEVVGMFALSWLDLRRLPVRIDSRSLDAQYVSANIATTGVMIWFILDESGMHLRCRYPDTLEARGNVGGWLDSVVDALRTTARTSVRHQLVVGEKTYQVEPAARDDVEAMATQLRDDEITANLESNELDDYVAAFDRVTRNDTTTLFVVRDRGQVIAMMQLSIIPGFSRSGASRLILESVRVTPARRSRGIGQAMVAWAHEHGRAHGATIAEINANMARTRAREFFARQGYEANQIGMKRRL